MNEDKATRYHRRRRRAGLMGSGAAALALVLLIFSGASAVLAGAIERLVGAAATPSILRAAVATVVFTAIAGGVVVAARFPFDVYREWTLDRAYALERVPFRAWCGGYVRGLAVQAMLLGLAALVVRACAWIGMVWWIGAALLLWGGYLAWTHAAPLVLLAFGGLRPLTRPHVVERLHALGRRAGALLDVYEWRGGDDSRRAHAALGGVGRTRRVILSDTLLESLTLDEIEVVVAHELAHHVHGDVWTSSLWRLFVLLTAMGTASLAIDAVPTLPALDPRALASLPVIGGVAWIVAVLVSPAGYALSRAQERRADRFAVEITGNIEAFLTSMRRLAASNLIEDRPSRLARLMSSHPPIRDRMTAAVTHGRRMAR